MMFLPLILLLGLFQAIFLITYREDALDGLLDGEPVTATRAWLWAPGILTIVSAGWLRVWLEGGAREREIVTHFWGCWKQSLGFRS